MASFEIQQALADLEDKNGRLTPETVVAAARSRHSPLHSHFEWDDSKAAEEYRLNQARKLIRGVKIDFRVHRKIIHTVAYVHDPSLPPDESGYRSIQSLQKDEDDAREAVMAEFKAAAAHLARARLIGAVLSLQQEIENLLEQLGVLLKRIEGSATKQ